MKEKISIIVLGCPKNEVDAEVLAGELNSSEFIIENNIENSEIVIILTCAFIEDAVEEAIDTILEITSIKNRVIVVGCLVSRYGADRLKEQLPEVEIFFDTYNYLNVVDYLKYNKIYKNYNRFIYSHNNQRVLSSTFSYVKIAEGCRRSCSFCTIPQIKGGLFSRQINDIIDEIKKIVESGIYEIILISQNSGDYGKDLKNSSNLTALIEQALKINDLKWLRVLYIYPDDINEYFLELTRHEKFCKYLDIPIQHIDNDILKSMNRKTDENNIKRILDNIKTNYPEIFLRTSLIVGYPGETDEKFNKLLNFIKQYQFYNLGCFKYFREEGTTAAALPGQVANKIKNIRYKKIMQTQKKVVKNINKTLTGKIFQVNISGFSTESELLLEGRTEFQSPDIDGITFINEGIIDEAGFYKVKITDFADYDLIGKIV
jgi:ribosomal protein S12 methylthiotransferase